MQTFAINETTGTLTAGALTSWNQSYALQMALAVSRTAAGATLSALQVVPAPATLVTSLLGTTQQLTAVGTYSDGTAQFLTASATWTSSDAAVATVSNVAGSQGRATSTGYGTTTITASFGGFTAQSTLTVSAPPLTQLQITPLNPTIVQGTAVQLTATGTFADGTTRSVTAEVTWASTVPTSATVGNATGTRGLTTGIAVGSSSITATMGATTAAATVTVVAAPALTTATGRGLYAALYSPDGVAGFGINPTTNGVTVLPGSPFASAGSPEHVVATPSGRFVYVAHNSNSGTNAEYRVSAYTVDGNTGALSPVQGSPYQVASYVQHLAVDPAGRYLYSGTARPPAGGRLPNRREHRSAIAPGRLAVQFPRLDLSLCARLCARGHTRVSHELFLQHGVDPAGRPEQWRHNGHWKPAVDTWRECHRGDSRSDRQVRLCGRYL